MDRATLTSVTSYLTLTPAATLPTVEDTFCPSSLASLRYFQETALLFEFSYTLNMGKAWPSPAGPVAPRSHLTPYSGPGSALEATLVSLQHGRAIDLWPEGPLTTATYELPQVV